MSDIEKRCTSELLEMVVANNNKDTITIGEIKHALHERGFGVLMAIAALPLCLPLPVPPGYTTLFSIPLFILSVQMIWGLDAPWLPKWLERKEIKRNSLAKLVEKSNPWLRRIEKLLRPRMNYFSPPTWEKIIGVTTFIFSVSIALPLPLTNFLPGWGILFMSLGLLSKDGLMILIGIVTGLAGILITILIIIGGVELVKDVFRDTPIQDIIEGSDADIFSE